MNSNPSHVGETVAIRVKGLVDDRGAPIVDGTATATVTGPTGAVTTTAFTYDELLHQYTITFVPLVEGPHRAAVQVEAEDGTKFRAKGGAQVLAWP